MTQQNYPNDFIYPIKSKYFANQNIVYLGLLLVYLWYIRVWSGAILY